MCTEMSPCPVIVFNQGVVQVHNVLLIAVMILNFSMYNHSHCMSASTINNVQNIILLCYDLFC